MSPATVPATGYSASAVPFVSPRAYSPSLVSTADTEPPVATPASGRYDVMHELREATSTPSPLGEFLRDPAVLTALMGHKKTRRGSTSSSHRDRERDREREREHEHSRERDYPAKEPRRKTKDTSDTSSILTLVLAEEERQAHHLKAVLRNTGERLDYEMRRADQAELRARTAEGHSREVALRIATAENGRHQAELETARVREETKRFQLLAEASERELRRVEADMQRLERMRKEAEQNAADSRDLARKAQQALREHQAREEGREEGRMLEMRRKYNDGREDGFEDGRAEGYENGHAEGFETGRSEGYASGRTEGYNAGRLVGFEEGRKVGWSEGYADGLKQGRREERVHAIEAFDKFMDSEERRQSVLTVTTTTDDDRTQRWVEATSQLREPSPLPIVPPPAVEHMRVPSPEPIRDPSPQPPRGPSPAPVPVWLHRRMNSAQEPNATFVPSSSSAGPPAPSRIYA